MARVFYGDSGDNKIFATTNKAQAYGLAGNDTLVSEGNIDVILIGGSGSDSLIIKDGNGTLSGGAGNDTFAFHYSETETLSAVIEDLNPSEDKIVINFDGTTAPQLSSSVKGKDVVLRDNAGNLNVTLKGVHENDYFDGTARDEIWRVLYFTNDEREKQNLPPLTLSDGLTAGASIRAEEITNLGQTGALNDHTRPNGSQWYTVLDGKYNYIGENLDGGAESPAEVLSDWMNSKAHKKNILDKKFRKLGVGYNYFDIDESDHRWYWVQLFADSLKATETVSTNELSTASPEISAAPKFITLTENPDTYSNAAFGATVDALGGGDFIANTNSVVSISGGADNDTIDNSGSYVVINAGTGDDSIHLSDDAELVYFQYATGDGNDTISGFNDTSVLSIPSDEFVPVTVGNDVVVAVGDDSITLKDATKSIVQIEGTTTKLLIGTKDNDHIYNQDNGIDYIFGSIDSGAGNDTIKNYISNVKINSGSDNDSINNYSSKVTITSGNGNDFIVNYSGGSSVSIDSGTGDDTIANLGAELTINGGDGNDFIRSNGDSVTIDSGTGDDTIGNHGSTVTISGGEGNDSIYNQDGSSVNIDSGASDDTINNLGSNITITITSGDGNDDIYNDGNDVTIDSGAGDDTINNLGSNVTITSSTGNDSIYSDGNNTTIDSGAGDDSIRNYGDNVTIDGGNGDDYIRNWGDSVTIDAGAGDDRIYKGNTQNNLIQYKLGDGNDINSDFNSSDTIKISGSEYTSATIGNNIVLEVGTNHILLFNAASLSAVNIVGTKSKKNKLIMLTEGDDTCNNTELGATINALGGNDLINNTSSFVIINGDANNDSIESEGSFVVIDGGTGNDLFYSYDGDHSTLLGDAGDDIIYNDHSWWVSIVGGVGDDSIVNDNGYYSTLNGGTGNDIIGLTSSAKKNLIEYTAGDGNDTIEGFKEDDTLSISESEYTFSKDGNDVIVNVGTNSIKLFNSATLSSVKIMSTRNGGKIVTLAEDKDILINTVEGATIAALGGNDIILNNSDNVSISCGVGDDSIGNFGSNAVLEGNDGDDTIESYGGAFSRLDGGDGHDYIINGFNDDDNSYGDYSTIDGGEGNDSIANSGLEVTISSGCGDDTIVNSGAEAVITSGDGNDSIHNGASGSSVSIDSGIGDDTIGNLGSLVTITSGDGNDSIHNGSSGSSVSIDSGEGDNTIANLGSEVTITGGSGKDSIHNEGNDVTIDSGAGDDTIANLGSLVTIISGSGNNSIRNQGASVSISAGAGDDSINNHGSNVSITGGTGNDYIYNDDSGSFVSIDSGDGNDTIVNHGSNVSINGGAGNDSVCLFDDAQNNFISYADGDGNDTIWGFKENDTLNISAESYSTIGDGNDKIVLVGDGAIRLVDAREKPVHIIIGESGTSGGGSGSGGSDGGSSSGGSGDGGGRGGNDGGNTSGGTSSNEGRGSDASGSRSAVGSAGRGTSTNTDTGGSTVRVSSSRSGGSRIAGSTNLAEFMNALTPATQQTTAQLTANPRVYSGDNQIISDYISGEKIIFNAAYIGSFYDDAGNYCVGSSTGALVIQNATDKVIDLSDAADNSVIKAYAASSPGVIDGRGLTGFEVINGSAGSDAIYAGDGDSQLWGGADYVQDVLVGGNGTDISIGGRTQGADIFFNASAADIVHLNDASLSDIIATEENNGSIAIAFNTGNVIGVQSSELLSAAFMLADGSSYRYNHATRNWQTA